MQQGLSLRSTTCSAHFMSVASFGAPLDGLLAVDVGLQSVGVNGDEDLVEQRRVGGVEGRLERFGRHQAISDQKIIRAKRLHADDAEDKRHTQGKGGTQTRVKHALGVPVSDEMVAGEQDVETPARRGP